MTLDDPKYVKPIVNKGAIKHYRESALMTAIHILICLIQGKSREDIAKDFDNNLESVCVWIDYMIGIDWVYRQSNRRDLGSIRQWKKVDRKV